MHLLLMASCACLAILASCGILRAPARPASISLSISHPYAPGGGARTVWPGAVPVSLPGGDPAYYVPTSFNLSASGPNGRILDLTGVNLAAPVAGFVQGDWNILISAFNASGDYIGNATIAATLSEGSNVLGPYILDPVLSGGPGSFSLQLSWDAAIFAAGGLDWTMHPVNPAGADVSGMIDLNPGDSSAGFSGRLFPPGAYRLILSLRRADDTVMWGTAETVYIAPGEQTMYVREDLEIYDLATPLSLSAGPPDGVIVDDGTSGTPLKITFNDPNAVIVYTLDGSDPEYDFLSDVLGPATQRYDPLGGLEMSQAFEATAVANGYKASNDDVLTFRIRAYNAFGGTGVLTLVYHLSDAIYAAADGTAGDIGLKNAPNPNLQEAIDRAGILAQARNRRTWVRIEKGNYQSPAQGFMVPDGACLSGNWEDSFASQTVPASASALVAVDSSRLFSADAGYYYPQPNASLRLGASISSIGNELEYLYVEGPASSTLVTALWVDGTGTRSVRFRRSAFRGMGQLNTDSHGAIIQGAEPALSFDECYFVGREAVYGSNNNTSGILIKSASPRVEGGEATAGKGNTVLSYVYYSAGVAADGPNPFDLCTPVFTRSAGGQDFTTRGSSNPLSLSSFGFRLWAVTGVIEHCFIDSGMADAINGRAYGIHLSSAEPLIQDCRINETEQACAQGYGIYHEWGLDYGSPYRTLTITSSIIYGAGAAGTGLSHAIEHVRGAVEITNNPLIQARDAQDSSIAIHMPGTAADNWIDARVQYNINIIAGNSNNTSGQSAGIKIGNGTQLPLHALVSGNMITAAGTSAQSMMGIDILSPMKLVPGQPDLSLSTNYITVEGGPGVTEKSRGLSIATQGSDAGILVERNKVWGGSGSASASLYGLYVNTQGSQNGDIVIRNNIIHGGINTVNANYAALYIGAMIAPISPMRVYNNTLYANGSAVGQSVLRIAGNQSSRIMNNLIIAGSGLMYGVYQEFDSGTPYCFWHNAVYADVDPTYYRINSVPRDVDITDYGTNNWCKANILGAFGSPPYALGAWMTDRGAFIGYAFDVLSDSLVRGAGFDISTLPATEWPFTDDFDGPVGTRTATLPAVSPGWTIGAQEWD